MPAMRPRLVTRSPVQVALELFAFGDIDHGAKHAHWLFLRVTDDICVCTRMVRVVAVGTAKPIFARPRHLARFQRLFVREGPRARDPRDGTKPAGIEFWRRSPARSQRGIHIPRRAKRAQSEIDVIDGIAIARASRRNRSSLSLFRCVMSRATQITLESLSGETDALNQTGRPLMVSE